MEKLSADACFIGEASNMDDEYLDLAAYGTFRSMDRSRLVVRYDEITRIDAGGRYELQLKERFAATAGT